MRLIWIDGEPTSISGAYSVRRVNVFLVCFGVQASSQPDIYILLSMKTISKLSLKPYEEYESQANNYMDKKWKLRISRS